MRYTAILLFLYATLSLVSVSCKKFLAIPPPQNQIEEATLFTSDETAVSAVTGLYSRFMATPLTIVNGGVTLYTGLTADELRNTAANQTADAFFFNTLPANSSTVTTNFWAAAYRNIYHANNIIEQLTDARVLTDTLKKQLTGEALVLRALNYFYLVNLFGDVPLQTTTDYRINAVMPRSSAENVYRQMVNDLKEAESSLPANYITTGRLRVNKYAAAALLARVHLFMGNWADAEEEATSVINAGVYTLHSATNISNAFKSSSLETILEMTRESANSIEGATFLPSSATARPTYAINQQLLGAFESGDMRRQSWIGSSVVATPAPATTYYFPSKYKLRAATTPVQENIIFFRLAEQILIRAEARALQNKLLEGLEDVNLIRTAAGLPNTTATDQAGLLSAIEQERRIELMFEWGHRWLDLKRTHKIDDILSVSKAPNWQTTDALFPIPKNELDLNLALHQNPGYQ